MAEEELITDDELEESSEFENQEIVDNTPHQQRPSQKTKLLKYLFTLVGFAGFIALSIFVVNIVYKSEKKRKKPQELHYDSKKKVIKKPPKKITKLPVFRFNLREPDGKSGVYVHMEIALAFMMKVELQNEIAQRTHQFRDMVISIMSKKTFENINTPEKVKYLKEQIQREINSVLINGKIEDIYFINFNIVPRS